MPPKLYLALIAAAVLNLDRHCLGQIALSRPLVTGLLVGLILELPAVGALMGMWAELLWLTRSPLGGLIPPNGGLAVSSALIALFMMTYNDWAPGAAPPSTISFSFAGIDWPLMALAFTAVIPLAHSATMIEKVVRVAADRFSENLNIAIAKRCAAHPSNHSEPALEPLEHSGHLDHLGHLEHLDNQGHLDHSDHLNASAPSESSNHSASRHRHSNSICSLRPVLLSLLLTLALSAAFLIFGSALLTFFLILSREFVPAFLWLMLGKAAPFIPIIGLALMTEHLKGSKAIIYLFALTATFLALTQINS
ncbi:MAG: PTS sugar transporter subunit IIC [Deltaproteobacteria bacterium]|jgi:mannose/fructose/N-acetylgalactosamine-specific phosphotransferase system component IIC|nr:PTS sugar transporter subunit IIC [Deltaproteobacteria bacterium]